MQRSGPKADEVTAMTTSVIAILNWYLSCAVLLSICALLLSALLRWGPSLAARAPERWLAVGWTLLALALLLPLAWRAAGPPRSDRAALEIWSGPRFDAGAASPARMTLRWTNAPDTRGNGRLRPVHQALGVGIAFLAGGQLLCLVTLVVRRRRLGRLCADMPIIKRVGRVRVCASDHAPAPFAARARGSAFIVVPTALLTDSARLRLVIAHEAHHHRRGDLHTAAALGFVRALFFWNPLLTLGERAVAELQDFVCDRRVLRRPHVSPIDYSRALLWAAEAANGRRYVYFGARGIADGSAASLARRVTMLIEAKSETHRVWSWLFGGAAFTLILAASWVVQGAVADHRVTRPQADALAARIAKRSGFPLLVDDQVVARLNQWVADPKSRELMKKAMERMPTYRGMIEKTMRAHGLPAELLGMVMAESAFDNEAHPDTPVERRSMGIWQLIPSTGRRLGLEVSPTIDERLEPRKATEAAAQLLTQLFDRYGDWPVAIAAYNAGDKKVTSLAAGATSKAQMRALVLAGGDEHARYVRSVMASVILIETPSLLE
jgi:Zn-dependent protease with chaperone function